MKAEREQVDALSGHSFVAYAFEVPHFEFRWHYHPEYELTLITKGEGKRMVGDSHEPFSEGDLVLVGPGVPHTWSSPAGSGPSAAVVVQFTDAFISHFSTLPEFRNGWGMLQQAGRGRHFRAPSPDIADAVRKLPERDGISRLTSLISILESLGQSGSTALASPSYSAIRNTGTANRVNKICHYVQESASEGLSLDRAAALAHLSPSAFCKFFRRHMGRSFSDYVNEIRIADACLQLIRTDKTIREVAGDTGFDSLTYFNRIFSRKRGMTPSAFRKKAKSVS